MRPSPPNYSTCYSWRNQIGAPDTGQQYFSSGLAASTRKVYSTALNQYIKFCNQYSLCTTPASEILLCRYVTYLALDRVSANSLRVYQSAIRQLHLQQRLPPPVVASMPRLQQVLRGIRISQARSPETPTTQRARLPITPPLLRNICHFWSSHPQIRTRPCSGQLLPLVSLVSCDQRNYIFRIQPGDLMKPLT